MKRSYRQKTQDKCETLQFRGALKSTSPMNIATRKNTDSQVSQSNHVFVGYGPKTGFVEVVRPKTMNKNTVLC